MHICEEHYPALSRMQKRKWKAINCVGDLGDQAELFAEREYLSLCLRQAVQHCNDKLPYAGSMHKL